MMKSSSLTFMFCLLATGLPACTDNQTVAPPDYLQVTNRPWRVISFDTVAGGTIYLNPIDTVILFLAEDGIVRGKSFGLCGNYLQGVYSFSGFHHLQLDSLSSTEALCSLSRWWDVYRRLESVTEFRLNGLRLHLYYDNHRQEIVLESQPFASVWWDSW